MINDKIANILHSSYNIFIDIYFILLLFPNNCPNIRFGVKRQEKHKTCAYFEIIGLLGHGYLSVVT